MSDELQATPETIHCVICTGPIPEERDKWSRGAVTCSDECKNKLNQHRRKKKDAKICRFCSKPSTLEERTLFQRWRRETFPQPKKGRPRRKPEAAPVVEAATEPADAVL